MKLLIVTSIFPPEIGGPASYTNEITSRLTHHDISLITFTKNPTTKENTQIISVPTTGGFLVRQARLLVTLIQIGKSSDVIYAQDPLVTGLAAVIVGRILKKPVVIKYVGDPAWENQFGAGKTKLFLEDYLSDKSKDLLSKIQIILTRMVISLAAAIIVPSKFLEKIVVSNYGANGDKVKVIYNAIDVPKVFSHPRVDRKESVVVTIGRLVNWKNIGGIINAVKSINKTDVKKIKLIIIGDGPEMGDLKKQADSKTIFAGRLSRKETLRYLNNADIFVLNSLYEGLPHTVLESFSCGTAVVATDIPGTTEIAIDGQTALTVRPRDDKDLENKIRSLLNNHQLSLRLARNGYQMVKDNFSWKTTIRQLDDLLVSTLNKKN